MLPREALTDVPRLRRAGVLAIAVLASAPLVAAAAPRHDRTPAKITAAAAGAVYGGVTPQGFAVMVEVNKSRRKIVRAAAGIRLTCTSGGVISVPDGWRNLSVSKTGKFKAAFGPETERNDDGTTFDAEGTVSGKFNSSRTSVSGTWTAKLTAHDATGAITDTCDSGIVKWTAKQ